MVSDVGQRVGCSEGAVGKSVGVLSGDMQDKKLNAKAQRHRDMGWFLRGKEAVGLNSHSKLFVSKSCGRGLEYRH